MEWKEGEDYKRAVGLKRGRARLYLPDPVKPGKILAYKVKAFRELEQVFVLSRGKEDRQVAVRGIPPHLLGESAARLKLVEDDARKRAFGFLVAMHLRGLDEKSARSVGKRAARKGFVYTGTLLDQFGSLFDGMKLLQDAKLKIALSTNPDSVLGDLAKRLGALKRSADLVAVITDRKQALIDAAFLKSKSWLNQLQGKAKKLPGGKLRLTYDWTRASQAQDWLAVLPIRDGFQATVNRETAENDGSFRVDASKKLLGLYGAVYVRHKLQWDGDVKLVFQPQVGTQSTEEGDRSFLIPFGVPAIQARRPSSYLGFSVGALLSLRRGELRPRPKQIGKEKIQKIFQAIGQREGVGIARVGDKLQMLAGDEVLTEMSVRTQKSYGAIMLLSPRSRRSRKESQPAKGKKESPTAVFGRLVIEGKPLAESLAGPRRRYGERWEGRFPH